MHLAIKSAKYVFLLLCLCGISICHAIGFGELKLYSYLGEPLYAEVAVTGNEDIDSSMLQIGLASAKDFMRAGIDRPYILNSLAFQIIAYDGKSYIVVRTNKPIQIPYLEFLIEISWPSGNLVKEFTILLDPPPVNLNEKTRPKGFGQLALEAAASQTANVNPIEQQVALQTAKQQKEAVEEELSKVVKTGSNKFSDRTFDTDIAQKPIIPGVVPDVTEESDEYNKQREAFEKSQQQNKVKPAAQSLLQKVVTTVDELKDDEQQNNLTVKQILDQEAAGNKVDTNKIKPVTPPVTSSSTTAAEAIVANEEPVDFQEVIKPVKAKDIQPAADKPSAPILTSPATPPVPEKPANHMYLGVILSLLLIAVGVVIAIKRGLLKPFHKPNQDVDTLATETKINEIAVNENADENKMRDAIAEFNAEEETEEIELASLPDGESKTETKIHKEQDSTDEDLSKFEETFANLDLNELREDVNANNSKLDTPVIDQISAEITTEPSNLSNQSEDLVLANKALEAELKSTKPELTVTEQEITQYITENENIVTNTPISTNVSTVAVPETIDEVIEEIPVAEPSESTADTTASNYEIREDKSAFEETIDEVIEEIPVAEPSEPTADSAPSNYEIIEDKPAFKETIDAEKPIEPTQQTIESIVEPVVTKELELFAEDNVKNVDITLMASDDVSNSTENLQKESMVTGPTMQNNASSELHLSEEGATLVSSSDMRILDTEDAVAMKIKLAKKYIESGDRDSAKELLLEAMEIANDDQKLEARLLLGSIE